MIKLVMTDLDKTLLDDNANISRENIKAIKSLKDKNVSFGIASGRGEHIIRRIIEESDLVDDVKFIISHNGVSLYEKNNDEHVHGNFLSKESIKEIYTRLKDLEVSFVVHRDDIMLCSKSTKFTEEEKVLNQFTEEIVEDFTSILDKDYSKLMVIGDPEVLETAISRLKEYNSDEFEFFKTYYSFLEAIAKNQSKGRMLKVLCERNNIDINQVLAVGDNYNDLDMIQASGYGVAVSNAVESVKESAKLIVSSNNENGFAEAIKHYID